MNLNTKRRYKKYCRKFSIIAWLLVGLFFLSFITLTIFAKNMSNILISVLGSTMVMSLILGLVFNFSSDLYRRTLIRYKNNINEYRNRRKYVITLNLIKTGDLYGARKVYNTIPRNHILSEKLYTALIHEFIHSSDEKLIEIGEKAVYDLLVKYDPFHFNINDY